MLTKAGMQIPTSDPQSQKKPDPESMLHQELSSSTSSPAGLLDRSSTPALFGFSDSGSEAGIFQTRSGIRSGVDGYRAGNQIDQTTPTWGWRLRRSRFLRIRNPSSQVKGSRAANLIGSEIRDPWPGFPDQVRNRFAMANLRPGHLTTPSVSEHPRTEGAKKSCGRSPHFVPAEGRNPEGILVTEGGPNYRYRRGVSP